MKTLPAETSRPSGIQPVDRKADATGTLARLGIGFTAWAERWFPDAFLRCDRGGHRGARRPGQWRSGGLPSAKPSATVSGA